MESEFTNAKIDAIRFNDFIKDFKDISSISPQYQQFMIMDILHMSKFEIDELDLIEYDEAFNYSVNTYRLRTMGTIEKKNSGGDHHTFEQPADFDIDPKFVSNPNYKGN